MLTLFGSNRRYCDGVSRRSFLKIGGLAMGGLALPDLLRAEERAGRRPARTRPSSWSTSRAAWPTRTRSTSSPTPPPRSAASSSRSPPPSPASQIGELLPEIARITDKLAILRSIVGLRDEHSSWQNLTGYPMAQAQREDRPHFGSVISRVQGVGQPGRPAVRRPVPDHAAQAVQQRGGRVPRAVVPGLEARRRRRPGADPADRRRARPVHRPPPPARRVRPASAGRSTAPRSRGWTPTIAGPSTS